MAGPVQPAGVASAKVLLEIDGTTAAYERELSKIPGFTETQARKAAESARKQLYVKLAKEASGLASVNEDAAKKTAAAWTDVGKKVSEIAGGPFASLGNAVFELVPKAGAASSALGAVAVAGVGIGAAIAAATAAAGAIVALAGAAAAAEERLVAAGRAADIPASARKSVQAYTASTTALRESWDLLVVTFGQDALTATAQVATVLSKAADAAAGAHWALKTVQGVVNEMIPGWETWQGRIANVAIAFVTLGASIPVQALAGFARNVETATENLDGLSNAALDYAIAQLEIDEQIKKSNEAAAKKILEARKKAAADAAKDAEQRASEDAARQREALHEWLANLEAQESAQAEATRAMMLDDNKAKQAELETTKATLAEMETARLEYYAEWREEIRKTRADDEAAAAAAVDAAKKAAEAKKAEAKAAQQQAADLVGMITEGAAAWAGLWQDIQDDKLQELQTDGARNKERRAATQSEIKDIRARLREAQKAGDSELEAALSLELAKKEARVSSLNDRMAAERKAIREVAKAQKAVAITTVTVQGIAAGIQAIAQLGPVAGAIAALAIAGTTARAIRDIKGTPLPTFFGGTGRVPGTPGSANGNLHGGEAVIGGDRQLAALMRSMIEASNRGTGEIVGALGRRGASSGGGGDIVLDGQRMGRWARRASGRRVGYVNPFGGGR